MKIELYKTIVDLGPDASSRSSHPPSSPILSTRFVLLFFFLLLKNIIVELPAYQFASPKYSLNTVEKKISALATASSEIEELKKQVWKGDDPQKVGR